jgi:hypothetical protein
MDHSTMDHNTGHSTDHNSDHNTGTSEMGSVVLDIGGDRGAAVVHTPPSLDGLEIEIRRRGAAWDGTHVAVRPRRIPAGLVYAALFPELTQGDYEVRVRGGVPHGAAASVSIQGGRVSQAHFDPTAA